MDGRVRGYIRELVEHLTPYVGGADAEYLAHRFYTRADEGTVAYWPDLLAVATRLRADHWVAGQPVTPETIATHERVLAEPIDIPVWGL